MTDQEYMDIAIKISEKSKYPYGAIIVKNNKIIGRSDNNSKVSSTPFCHAELSAIEDALKNTSQLDGLSQSNLCGTTIYSTCEPCPMCMGAILWGNISKLVYGATIEDSSKYYTTEVFLSAQSLVDNCKNREIEIISEVKREKAIEILKGKRKKL